MLYKYIFLYFLVITMLATAFTNLDESLNSKCNYVDCKPICFDRTTL